MRRGLFLGVASLLLMVCATEARSDVTFSGSLERVTSVSISIRLDDGRIIEAKDSGTRRDLVPGTLAERYGVGDRVEISCSAIKGVFEPLLGRRLYLEVTRLKSLREGSPEERADALSCKAWRQSPNLLHPPPSASSVPGKIIPYPEMADRAPSSGPAAEWSARLEQIRSHIVEFVSQMPNFVADELVTRYDSTADAPNWRPVDTIESQVTFKGTVVTRDRIEFNGKPWKLAYRELPGFKWTDGFGSQMSYLFDPTCPTTFEPGGSVEESGKPLSVVRYSSPPNGCEFYWENYEQFYPPKAGQILLDASEANVIRLETKSDQFPRAFPIAAVEKQVSWDFVKIGDATHLLPISAEILVTLSTGERKLARHEYKNHRHFEAASRIIYR
jgi:hypothetical protein